MFRELGYYVLAYPHHTVWMGSSRGSDICLYFSDSTCGFCELDSFPRIVGVTTYPLGVMELAWCVSIAPLGLSGCHQCVVHSLIL